MSFANVNRAFALQTFFPCKLFAGLVTEHSQLNFRIKYICVTIFKKGQCTKLLHETPVSCMSMPSLLKRQSIFAFAGILKVVLDHFIALHSFHEKNPPMYPFYKCSNLNLFYKLSRKMNMLQYCIVTNITI